jgi:hypothetical protein
LLGLLIGELIVGSSAFCRLQLFSSMNMRIPLVRA